MEHVTIVKADVYDEDLVRSEMAEALDVDPDEIEIQDSRLNVRAVTVTVGSREWTVIEDEDEAVKAAEERVEDDLEHEPEFFTREWLIGYIDEDRLREQLMEDETSSMREELREERSDDPDRWRETLLEYQDSALGEFALILAIEEDGEFYFVRGYDSIERRDADEPGAKQKPFRVERKGRAPENVGARELIEMLSEEAEMPVSVAMTVLRGLLSGEAAFEEMPDPEDDDVLDEIAAARANESLEDPVAHVIEIYGNEEGIKHAIEWGGIEYERAAQDAVSADGWAHFLSTYDGNYETTPSGFVYYRE